MAISWLSSLSSARRIFLPWKETTGPGRASSWPRGTKGVSSSSRSSDRKMGLEQKAVTPASLASSSMSDQS